MSKTKDILYHSAVYTGGLVGSFVLPVLTGGMVGDKGILSDMFKEVFKGLTGTHFPGFQKALHRRLYGVDAAKLNHDLQHALKRAVDQTGRSLTTTYRKSTEPKYDTDERYLNAFCDVVKKALDEKLSRDPSRYEVTAFVEGHKAEGKEDAVDWDAELSVMMQAVGEKKRLPCSIAMRKVIEENFHNDLQLHFMEELKDKDTGEKTRVAFEELTSKTILEELKSIRSAVQARPGVTNSATAFVQEVHRTGDQEAFSRQLEGFMAKYPDEGALRAAFAPQFDAAINSVMNELAGLRSKLDGVHEDLRDTNQGVQQVGRKSSRNIMVSSAVLVVVLAVVAFIITDPMHWRSFPVKVEVFDALSYGTPGREATLLAIDHGGIRDTVEVVNGRASFMIPNGSRNDDAVLHLLCREQGQTMQAARLCDSATVRLTDQDRIRFGRSGPVAVADTMAEDAPTRARAGKGGSQQKPTAMEGGGHGMPPPCSMDGLAFVSEASLQDRLALTKDGGGRAFVSGEVNRKSVDGSFKVNGATLTAVPGSGSLVGGTLRLSSGCGRITGTLTVRSMTGNVVSERIDMVAEGN